MDFAHRLELAIVDTEKELSLREAELQEWAAGEQTELSSEIASVRLSVENGRQKLAELHKQKERVADERERLEIDLRSGEMVERRRSEVALETEQTLSQVRDEMGKLKREYDFLDRNRLDLERAL